MTRLLLSLLLLCSRAYAQLPPPNVGDIRFDPALDDTSFQLCDSDAVFQYYNSNSYWLNNKDSIVRFLREGYRPPPGAKNQNGWLTIKFVINCQGRTGRYRLFEMDNGYQRVTFDPRISTQLLALVRKWPGWRPARYRERNFDTYQYIGFRLRAGRIITISP